MAITSVSFLTRAGGLAPAAFERHWAGPHAALVSALPGVRRYEQGLVTWRSGGCVDGVAWVTFDDLDALRAAVASPVYRGVRADELDLVDTDALWAVVVERHAVIGDPEGSELDGATRFVGVMRRREDMDVEAYRTHWQGPHARLAAGLPGLLAYTHDLPVPLSSRPPPVDGIAELWFPDEDAVRSAFRSEAGRQVGQDEPRFVDPARSFALRTRTRRIL